MGRWLLHVTGNWYGYIVYWDLTTGSGWHHVSTLIHNYNQNSDMTMVSLR